MNCAEISRRLPLLLYGELTLEEENTVQDHLAGCDACSRELQVTRAWQSSVDDAEGDVAPMLLADCRRNLRVSLSSLPVDPMRGRGHWVRQGLGWLIPDLGQWRRAAAAVSLIAVGFVGARLLPERAPANDAGTASASLAASDPIASRVRYVEPDPSGEMQMVVEETRERTLSCNLQDERARRLMMAAARESTDPGLRVEMVNLLNSRTESAEVRRVLRYALTHDTNPGVRLKALDGLRSFADDPETRSILSQVLLTDGNPGVRTQVIDLLVERKEPAMVGVLQQVMQKEANGYVRMRCQKVLHEMNASVETF